MIRQGDKAQANYRNLRRYRATGRYRERGINYKRGWRKGSQSERKGLERVKIFSWENTAKVKKVYDNLSYQ